MTMKKIMAGTAMAGALGLAALGLGAGIAQADPKGPGPGHDDIWLPGDPPGHNPFGPPGQVKKDPFLGPVPNPFYGVPPGHWDDPAYFGLPTVWLPPDIPGVTEPLPLVFNPDTTAWGVWIPGGVFIPFPV